MTVPPTLQNPETLLQATPWIAPRYADEPGRVDRVLPVICLLLGDTLADTAPAARPLAALTADFDGDDWQLFAVMAEGERIAPLLYWLFSQNGNADQLPEPVWNRLKTVAQAVAVRNMRYFQVLDQVLDLLAQHGIEVIVLKGPALAKTIYPNPLLRPMSDLDILVKAETLRKTVSVLTEAGWSRHEVVSELFLDLAGPDIPMNSPAHIYPPLMIDVHWVLVDTRYKRVSEPAAWAWESTTSQPLSFGPAASRPHTLLLDPSANTLYVAAHGYWRHRYDDRSLGTLRDFVGSALATLATPDGLTRLIADARTTGWATPLRAALEDSVAIFGDIFPASLVPGLQALENSYSRDYLELKNNPDGSMVADQALPLLHALTWPGRVRFVATVVWPARKYLEQRYTAAPSASPMRLRWWGELIQDIATFAWHRLFRSRK